MNQPIETRHWELEKLYSKINTAGEKQDYPMVVQLIRLLAYNIRQNETETVGTWYIGEDDTATDFNFLDLLIGSYWFFADYHGGQASIEYQALSQLSLIFKPGPISGGYGSHHTGPDSEGEAHAYEWLKDLHTTMEIAS